MPELKKISYKADVMETTLTSKYTSISFNPLTPELNPSAQRCLPRFFTGDFNF
jgi:hypothetical protein